LNNITLYHKLNLKPLKSHGIDVKPQNKWDNILNFIVAGTHKSHGTIWSWWPGSLMGGDKRIFHLPSSIFHGCIFNTYFAPYCTPIHTYTTHTHTYTNKARWNP
jgi:hypothetical protein